MKSKKAAPRKAATSKSPEGRYLRLSAETHAAVQQQARHFGYKGVMGEEKALGVMIAELIMIRGYFRYGQRMLDDDMAAIIAAADPLRAAAKPRSKKKKGKS